MRKHRFFVAMPLAVNTTLRLDAEVSHHISRVLRLKESDLIYLFNNTGAEYSASIENIARKHVTVNIINIKHEEFESPLKINLGQVISKGEKIELVIQKATELGVQSITILYSERSLIQPARDRMESKMDHWQKVAQAACSQCWRNVVPIINPTQELATWITQNQDPQKLLLSPVANGQRLRDLQISNPVSILIGPEGGFSETEIALAIRHKFTPISLGPRILRTETAALAAIAILQAQFGDL